MRALLLLPLLALLTAAGGASAADPDWLQAEAITIVADEYKFDPGKIELRAGMPYRLHFENRGKELHEYNGAALFAASDLGNPEALNAERTEILLHPGERKDLLIAPKKPGQFAIICPDHDWAGMTGEVVVR